MSQMSNFLEDGLLDHAFNNTALGAVATMYLSLHTGSPGEANDGANELAVANGYARQSISANASSAGVVTPDTDIVFTNTGADWSQATHIGFYDASTAGNLWFYATLDTARTCLAGGTLTFSATTGFTVTAA